MARDRWHILKEDGALTLARQLPARFDLSVSTVIPGGAGLHKERLARQVRQDMWRALQTLRGFAPVVRVSEVGADIEITAGGAIAGPYPKEDATTRLRGVLDNPNHRARWTRHSQIKRREP
ncbi:hypothetical protein [Celeribacter litoreus]|uniref:hypothetical protein n=1 Tax=Celeribacter litoreus TaxID=2876714 RepID=UPI001CCBDA01|nr:hypothetical protein [Celeribacter litoreus]MCA0042964.1 hypothetical protein [Celeribacter litoreus]